MKNLSSITDNEDIITKEYVSNKENTSNKVTSLSSSSTNTQYPSAKCVYDLVNSATNTFDVSKVYYVGEVITGGGSDDPDPDPNPDPTPSGDPEDITSQLPKYGDYRIDSTGTPIASSGANFCYKCDLSIYTPTSVTAATRSTSFLTYAFYSSTDTFDSTTYISGGSCSQASTSPDTANVETLTISSIPSGALTMLAVQYYTSTFTVMGVVNGQSSSQTRSVTVEEATEGETTTETVSDAITQWNTDGKPNAIIHKEAMIPTHIYRVGSGRTYATLVAAVAQWVTDGKPIATIYVDSGTYISISNPSDAHGSTGVNIVGSTNRLTIIGEDRDSTIVKSTTGKYIHPAIDIKGGNVTIKNMTFIADHSDNANFVYLDPGRPNKPNSAYAIHCDGGSTPGVIGGVIEFENCNMWSWQSQGLGCGTVPNGQVIVRNCDIRSFVPGYASGTGLDEEEYAKYLHGTRGAIIYHTSPSTATSHEGFTLINSSIYIKGGTTPIKLMNDNGSNKSGIKMLTFINNTFWNGIETQNVVNVPSSFAFNKLSSGNNISTLNGTNAQYSLKIE